MSRAAIPGNKNSVFKEAYRQVCAYVFPRKKLLAFTKKKKTRFENIEDIEILRFLELGYEIKMVKLSQISKSVDTKSDVKKILNLIN